MARFWVVFASLAAVAFRQVAVLADRGELFSEKGQKDYSEDEDGKLVPHRYHFIKTYKLV